MNKGMDRAKDTARIFLSIKAQILQAPAYRGVAAFPDEVRYMRTLEELIWWLGTANFALSPLGGETVALSHLALTHSQFDTSQTGLMRLLSFLLNLDTPGFFLGNEKTHNEFPIRERIAFSETTEAIASAVRQRPHQRKAVAQYIIFEDLGAYDTLTLAQLAAHVEHEYRRDFGDTAFTSSTRDVMSALASYPSSERETMRQMLSLALEIGTHHIRSFLAINWLTHVRLRDPAVQQELDRLKQASMKQIWQHHMMYTTADPKFLNVLLRGGSFEDQRN